MVPGLFPGEDEQSLSITIPENHVDRLVGEAVEKIDVYSLLVQDKGGGTSYYHTKMLLKVLVSVFAEQIFVAADHQSLAERTPTIRIDSYGWNNPNANTWGTRERKTGLRFKKPPASAEVQFTAL
jgi:hypothetical protein